MKTLVVDSDVLIALTYNDDPQHEEARRILQQLLEIGVKLVVPSSIILEAIAALKRGLDLPMEAHLLNRQYLNQEFNVQYVDEQTQTTASQLFETTDSKKNTIFDCVVVAVVKHLQADGVF